MAGWQYPWSKQSIKTSERPRPADLVIQLAGREIPYKLVPRRAGWGEGFSVSVGLSGVRVSASSHYRRDDLEKFLNRHSVWLLKQVARVEERLSRIPQRFYLPGETFPLEGKEYPIEHRPVRGKSQVEFTGTCLRFHCREASGPKALKPILERFLKAHGHDRFREKVQHYARQMNLKPKGWVLRNQKARWGSCSPAGVLYLNWRLILGPPEVLDYIVIHELAHLAHGNHGERYWKRVAAHCPDYLIHRAWLKLHGDRLAF